MLDYSVNGESPHPACWFLIGLAFEPIGHFMLRFKFRIDLIGLSLIPDNGFVQTLMKFSVTHTRNPLPTAQFLIGAGRQVIVIKKQTLQLFSLGILPNVQEMLVF